MGKNIKLKKGYNIPVQGEAEKILDTGIRPKTFALRPLDFTDIAPIPKLHVKEGDEVKAGDPLFYDKSNPDIQYTAPVSGEVVEIRRGPKRRIDEIVILADSEIQYKSFPKSDPGSLSREEIVSRILESGAWPLLRQRPFNVTADPKARPRDIFISGFNSAPLAPDYDFIIHGKGEAFQTGIEALRKLTEGKVHLNLNGQAKASGVFSNTKGVEINYFSGPHPAGNVGVQIHHINPIRKGEVVWTLTPQDVLIIGRLFKEGRFNTERIITVAGPEVKKPRYFQTYLGANIELFVQDNLKTDHVRFISGDILTGTRIGLKEHLGFSDQMFTVIMEGDQYEFMGWLLPSYGRPSISRTFWEGWRRMFFPNTKKGYRVNTNMHGEPRPYVMTGEYEKLLPMKMYPQQLIKSIIYSDFDEMEGLGIYEVIEEDLALCEFACTSKTRVQKILREGMELMREQG